MSDTLSAIVSSGRTGPAKPALYIGLAGDAPHTPPARISLGEVDRVDLGRTEVRSVKHSTVDGARVVTVSLADPRMSTHHARMSRVGGRWVLEDLDSKNGTTVGPDRIKRRPLENGDAILVGHTALMFRDAGGEDGDLDGAPAQIAPGLATLSSALAERYRELASAAKSNVAIEIQGETGTGKELVANAVHQLSGRTGRFVAVNCAALAGTLLEAELFGHKKGAFTGAAEDREGLIRSADGGTLFLDEVAELPLAQQATLLRVLQEGEVTPVGGDRPVKVDIRLVTATHRDLDQEVEVAKFRADLRARILGFEIALPPLRRRREDLAMLVSALLERHAPKRAVTFSSDAVAALYAHDWPLNIRELERSLAGALAVISADRIELQHLPASVGATEPIDMPAFREATPEEKGLKAQLTTALARHEGNIAAIGREMGKDPTQIRRWMKRFGLKRD
jgi:DNA-binding NtrC family response regulator